MRVRIGYQLSVTALFIAVVLAVGLALVVLSFDRARAITRSAAVTFIDRVAEHTADRVDGQFKAVLSALEALKQLPPVVSGGISDNPPFYATLAALLREHDQLYNLYVGYDDGAFIELDALDRAGPAVRAQLEAPSAAEFRLTVIDRPPGVPSRVRNTYYLSSDLEVVAQAQREADYDPRERPWYRGAFDPEAGSITEPYLFKLAGLTGYTVRAPFTQGRQGIVAGDILLADTDAFLKAQRLGQSGVVFLFDDKGRVIAHPRMSEFLRARPSDAAADLPRLDEIESVDIAKPLAGWQQGGDAQQVFEAKDGRTYVAAFRSIATAGSAHVRLAVMAPLDEFFSEVEAGRRRLLLLALAFVLAALPIVWWIGSMLARSMTALAVETDRIQRFEMQEDAGRVRSVIREIDDLGRSVSTMRAVVRTFSSFVPKRLVQQLVETGMAPRLGGSRRDVTILFTDIQGFTNIAEKADPEQVLLQTSRYFAALTEVIMAHGGTVDKFVGDAIMAIWNAPTEDADHVAHACAAVLACRDVNLEVNEAFEREGWPEYKTRFGLHTGEAVVGIIGSSDRMSYTALGATVNLAARLEPLNKEYGTDILVSEAVQQRVAQRFLFRLVDTIKPRGFGSAIRIFELRGEAIHPTASHMKSG
ncbi:adenylate/guanylate cyclase domain-containing protein [Microvirga massiliensis]|uniref:adenylate/guanylate cyclase domain-containing protein n=1 Tax=Microvirga massiliensis TaxID=1033741 RepID=UPI00062B68E1|nr:adenylate/guanylate cyclase domain-containing protein [Microvirga massiliensis]